MTQHSLEFESDATLIKDVFKNHFNTYPNSISLLPRGHWSVVYKVSTADGEFAIKIQKGRIDGLIMEAHLMDALRRLGIHTPIPYSTGYSIEKDRSYLVMSLVKGATLREVWKVIPKSERLEICRQIVEIITKMNSLSVEGCGRLSSNFTGEFSTLEEYTMSQIANFTPPRQLLEQMKYSWEFFSHKILSTAKQMSNNPIRFVHADFRMQNILYGSNSSITIIDFGNALAMLPSFDLYRFIRVDRGDELLSDLEVGLLERLYTEANPLYQQEKTFVSVILAMQLAVFSMEQGDTNTIKSFLHDLTSI